MKSLLRFIAGPIDRRYRKLLSRIQSLESVVDCLVNSPSYVDAEDVGFNGQAFRKRIFRDLLEAFDFDVIIETGTWTGNTTGYMAKTSGLPVHTSELNKLHYSVARMRLKSMPNINIVLGDAREFLRGLAETDLREKDAFVYLDAHWYGDLPLDGEIEIICNNWRNVVIMVDDFRVPGDEGYGYDDYGRRKNLSMRDFADLFTRHDLVPYSPTLPSSEETGARRGCVVLARRGEACKIIDGLDVLSQRDF